MSRPLSASPLLFSLAGYATLFPLSIGVTTFLSPVTGLRLFSLYPSKPASPDMLKLASNLMFFCASRDIFMACVAFAAYKEEAKRTLGWIYLAGAGVACCDGVMSQRQIGRDAWKHVMWVPVVVGVGGGLLGWWDGLF